MLKEIKSKMQWKLEDRKTTSISSITNMKTFPPIKFRRYQIICIFTHETEPQTLSLCLSPPDFLPCHKQVSFIIYVCVLPFNTQTAFSPLI